MDISIVSDIISSGALGVALYFIYRDVRDIKKDVSDMHSELIDTSKEVAKIDGILQERSALRSDLLVAFSKKGAKRK